MLPYIYQIVTNCRLRDSMSMTDTSNKRYIITAPQSDFILLPSDLVFVLMQFDHGTEYQPLLAGGWVHLGIQQNWRNFGRLRSQIVVMRTVFTLYLVMLAGGRLVGALRQNLLSVRVRGL